jgi:hypothetical protein
MKKMLQIAVVVAIAWGAGVRGQAEVYTAPLTLSEQTSGSGPYVTADFDFHTQFSQIDSIAVQFTMPDGFSAASTETLHEYLWMHVRSMETAPTFSLISTNGVSGETIEVPTGMSQQYNMYVTFGLPIYIEPPPPPWPSFLYGGTGSVDIADLQQTLVQGPVVFFGNTSNGPLSADQFADVSLIITGTAVPEPSGVILMAIAAVTALCGVPRRCCRRGPTTSG